ncbi:MAG TPA: hypothetical protein VK155_07775 [Bacteroidales bacterium]|nr:hypothetical protein [Bacteroidales bacterium]
MDASKRALLPARIISVIFHPLFMPVYGLAIILSGYTPFGYMQIPVKNLLFLIIVVNNVLLPLALLPFLMYMNFISSWTLEEREERVVPLIITTILYATSSYILYRFPVPFFLKEFFFSVFLVSLVMTVVNFRWKISLHAVAAGAITGLILILSFRLYSHLFGGLLLVIVAAGLIMSARLKMNLHNPRQVWTGFSAGFVLLTFFMFFLQQFS